MTQQIIENIGIKPSISRRSLLKGGLLLAAGLTIPAPAWAGAAENLSGERAISLYNLHTGESLEEFVYWSEGQYQRDSLEQLNWLLRDHRNDSVKPIDPVLFDMLGLIRDKLCNCSPLHVISGYRSPESNALLRALSSGVARNSLHIQGKALDVRMPDCELSDLRDAAKSLRAGGVGFYPNSDFVHIDTGRVRYW